MAEMSDDPGPDLVCADFAAALERLRGEGARLDMIWPADAPHSAILTHRGKRLRLTARPDAPPPSGRVPAFRPAFVLTRAGADPEPGRAGMGYRDLIPGRLGGHSIASHITIAEGGPVADWVHYHRIAFQLIVVRRPDDVEPRPEPAQQIERRIEVGADEFDVGGPVGHGFT